MDNQVTHLLEKECLRQQEMIGLIPSENIVSSEVSKVLSSCLSNKYSEGYPHRRYYEGNQYIDKVEDLAISRVQKLFNVPFVNVQPYSGSPANLAIYFALLKPNDTIMGLKLSMGGHLTHGHPKVTASGVFYHTVQYGLDKDARIDFKSLRELALKHRPKIIVAGTTAYPFILDFAKFREIADEVGAWLVTDISHITGLVIAGEHPSPVEYADVVMTTTHKTFRGPRGAMIMVTDRGLKKDPKLGQKINSAIIPGLQGGPHNATTAGIAVASKEASTSQFIEYGRQIVKNAKALAKELQTVGFKLVGDGTETHLILIDLTNFSIGFGTQLAFALDVAGIYVNRNTIPNEQVSPFYPSGLRVGTPLVTTRGMKEGEMKLIAQWMMRAAKIVENYHLPTEPKLRREFVKEFKKDVSNNQELLKIREEVKSLTKHFKMFAW